MILVRRGACVFLDLLALLRRIDSRIRGVAAVTEEYVGWVRRMLPRYPYWWRGHLQAGEYALEHREIGVAYAEAHAVIMLAGGAKKIERAGEFLLARSFLRNGEIEHAHQLLSKLNVAWPGVPAIVEELAATCMARGDFGQAVKALESVPEELLSSPAVLSLEYCRKKKV